MAQPDYRHTTTNIDVKFDPHGIRAWLSCVLDDGKMLLLATDRVTLQENTPADTAAIEQVARGLDIMMPEAIDLKFVAAPLTGNQLKELIQIPPRRNSRPEGSAARAFRRRSR